MQLDRKFENQEYAYQRGGKGNCIERPPVLQNYIDKRNAWLKEQPPMPKPVKAALEHIYECRACPNSLFNYIMRPIATNSDCDAYVELLIDNGLRLPVQVGGALGKIFKTQSQVGGAFLPVTDDERETILFAMNTSRQRSGMRLMNEAEKKRVIEVTNDILEAIDVISAAKGEANSGAGIYDSERFVMNFI